MLFIYELEACYRSLFPNLQKPRKVIASVKDQTNIIILEEYRKILGNCGCNICTVGEEVEPDRFGRLAANNYLSSKWIGWLHFLQRTVVSVQDH